MIPDEPVRGAYPELELLGLTGYEQMGVWLERKGPIAPVGRLVGGVMEEFNFDSASFSMPASPWLQTAAGPFPAAAALLVGDIAMGSSVLVAMPPATIFATAQIAISFVRPATVESHRLVAHSTKIHVSPALALSDLVVEDGHGRLLAHGSSRQVVLPRIEPVPEPLREWPPTPLSEHETPDPYLRPVEGDVWPQEVFDRLTGLEQIRAFQSGELPMSPLGILMGWETLDAEEGHVRCSIPASEWFASAARTVYGGMLALFADAAAANAVASTLPRGASLATLDLTVNFLRPVFPDGRPLIADARVVHRGKGIAVADVRIENADGKPVVIAKETVLVLEGRPWSESMSAASEEHHPQERE
jgi:acyl-CoA thioesterase